MSRSWLVLSDFFYGMTGYQFAHHARELKQDSESLFLIVTLGDLVGIPIMPPAYSLRLLPYTVLKIGNWKLQLARRKEFWEKAEYDLHGV
jgi:hypothetical protein